MSFVRQLEELYKENTEFHKENYYNDGLQWPSKYYPLSVPAFTANVSIGIIGQHLVGSKVLQDILGQERQRAREEFNLNLQVLAVAEHGKGSGKMLLSVIALMHDEDMSLDFINESWGKRTQQYDADLFMKHVSKSGRPHKVMLECSGNADELIDQDDLWSEICMNFETWLFNDLHIVTADIHDTNVSQYILATVMVDMENFEGLDDLWEEEERRLGPPTEPFQQGRMEGEYYNYLKGNMNISREEILKEHIKVFGVDPYEAGRVKQSRERSVENQKRLQEESRRKRDRNSDNRGRGGRRGKQSDGHRRTSR
eukprot:582697-Hanusia_phi.AAC.2